jgi:hypothetical protein
MNKKKNTKYVIKTTQCDTCEGKRWRFIISVPFYSLLTVESQCDGPDGYYSFTHEIEAVTAAKELIKIIRNNDED